MADSESIQVNPGETGASAPDQPIYEGYEPDESEASQEGEAQQSTEDQFSVPDKFMLEDGSVDIESLAKSYSELERAASAPEGEATDTDESAPPSSFPLTEEEMGSYGQELFESGDVSEASIAAMAEKGLPRELVQQFVEGQKALMAQSQAQSLDAVGGEESYQQIVGWAQENMSEQEIAAYDTVMTSGDSEAVMMNIRGLHARYVQATGRPNLISGNTGSDSAVGAYRSWAEVTAAMKDTKYHDDPAYRQDVQNRLAVSNLS